jgi:hypothetical protein
VEIDDVISDFILVAIATLVAIAMRQLGALTSRLSSWMDSPQWLLASLLGYLGWRGLPAAIQLRQRVDARIGVDV